MDRPALIEPGVKYFLNCTLNNCKQIKERYYTKLYNVYFFVGFVAVISAILYFKYKGKITPEEKEAKKRKEMEYIMSKLKFVNATHYAQSKGIPIDSRYMDYGDGAGIGFGMLTNLPRWSGPDEEYYKRK